MCTILSQLMNKHITCKRCTCTRDFRNPFSKPIRNGFKDVMIRVNKFLLIEFEESDVNIKVQDTGKVTERSELSQSGGSERLVNENIELLDKNTDLQKRANEEKKYSLYGVQVHYRVLQILFIAFLAVFGMSFVLFWNTFIVDEKIGCDSEWDCFYTSNSSLRETIDCTQYDENATTICFRIALKFPEGIGDAGGFMFAMQVLVNFLIYITVRVRSITCSSRRDKIGRFVLLGIIIIVQLVATVIVPLCLRALPEIQTTLRTSQRELQFWTYMYMSFILLIIVPAIALGVKTGNYFKTKV